MPGLNPDVKNQQVSELMTFVENNQQQPFIERIIEMIQSAETKTLELFNEFKNNQDATILSQRGIHQLTNNEKVFYNSLIGEIQNGVNNVTLALPVETANRVFDDLKKDHPLLSKINFVNNKGVTEWLITTEVSCLYAWGDLTDAITAEASSTIKKINFANKKLSAFLPVAKSIINLGVEWVDLYVRTILTEAVAIGLENGIINGNGQKQPVGMIKTVNIDNQTIPAVDKNAPEITDLSIETLGAIAKELTNGGKRKVSKMALLVHPVDYLTKILPCIRVLGTDGNYKDAIGFPLDIIESTEVTQGKVIFGLLDKYFATLGFNGKVEHSDHFKFLEDVRTYKIATLAYGTPKDDASFVVKAITALKPTVPIVKNK